MDTKTSKSLLSDNLDDDTLEIIKNIDNKHKGRSILSKKQQEMAYIFKIKHGYTLAVIKKFFQEQHKLEISISGLSKIILNIKKQLENEVISSNTTNKKEVKKLEIEKGSQRSKPLIKSSTVSENDLLDTEENVNDKEEIKSLQRHERLNVLREKLDSGEKLTGQEMREFWDLKTYRRK